MALIRRARLICGGAVISALLVAKTARADEGDDTLRTFLSKADLVVAGELLSEPQAHRSEIGVIDIGIELRVEDSIQGDALEGQKLRVRVVRYELVAGDELPWVRKGAKAILFLRNPRPEEGMGSDPVSADMWFGVQRMNRKMKESLKRLAAEAKTKVEAPFGVDPPRLNSTGTFQTVLGDDLVGILSDDLVTRGATLTQWRRRRIETVRALIEIADTPKNRYSEFDSRELAVAALGDMRATEAIKTLLKNISWRFDLGVTGEPSLVENYPCAQALSKMGIACVPTMLVYFSAHGGTEEEFEVAARLMVQIFGFETIANGGQPEALGIVERYSAKAGEIQRPNLRRFQTVLKDVYARRSKR